MADLSTPLSPALSRPRPLRGSSLLAPLPHRILVLLLVRLPRLAAAAPPVAQQLLRRRGAPVERPQQAAAR
eukprot:CAMPEP_0202792618 /NCGR_PEP_ID=MMETSP1388-20130828/84139_1 /ASSEMBLY_ACC=CAM_ASM_000864 /TAXON_ID=37098 /ORGANISM="Isochrysis sp, Strain CCMP1244" /LENGTH=70 /DNA_ID=CAMNT_0049462409 /DNA_START=36 /DNA_END=245 /DNA_ORIENTATION=-